MSYHDVKELLMEGWKREEQIIFLKFVYRLEIVSLGEKK